MSLAKKLEILGNSFQTILSALDLTNRFYVQLPNVFVFTRPLQVCTAPVVKIYYQ